MLAVARIANVNGVELAVYAVCVEFAIGNAARYSAIDRFHFPYLLTESI